ncbi:MAG: 16S rRNA processing protein RimM [Alphaproteobacteria bacterium]|nr:16S rRNA processing protein RimM [Alphaproteobacteria bacterium]
MEKRVCIGKIVAAHGIKGEVKVRSVNQNPLDLDQYGAVENADASKKFSIKVVGLVSTNARVKIEGVTTRNDAEALVGTELYVPRSALPELDEEEFYLSDLIGLDVCLKTPDKKIGKVAAFQNFGAGDIIELKLNGQRETEMLPFTKDYVPTINIDEGYIIVSSATMIFAADDEVENDAER